MAAHRLLLVATALTLGCSSNAPESEPPPSSVQAPGGEPEEAAPGSEPTPENDTSDTGSREQAPAMEQPGLSTGDPPCRSGIVRGMRSGDTSALRAAARSERDCVVLPREVPALLALVRDEEVPLGVRRFASRGLARAAPPDQSVPVLVEGGYQDALLVVGPAAIPPLTAKLGEDDDFDTFVTLSMLVADHPDSPQARQALSVFLPHLGGSGRRAVVASRAVGAFGSDLVDLLVERLEHGDDQRQHAARALAMIEDLSREDRAAAIAALERASTDADPDVRREAAAALERIRSREDAPQGPPGE